MILWCLNILLLDVLFKVFIETENVVANLMFIFIITDLVVAIRLEEMVAKDITLKNIYYNILKIFTDTVVIDNSDSIFLYITTSMIFKILK